MVQRLQPATLPAPARASCCTLCSMYSTSASASSWSELRRRAGYAGFAHPSPRIPLQPPSQANHAAHQHQQPGNPGNSLGSPPAAAELNLTRSHPRDRVTPAHFVHHPLRPFPHCRLQLPVPVLQTAQLRCVPTPPSTRSASGGCCRPCASPLAAATTLTVGAAQPLRRRLRPAHLEPPHPLLHTNPVLRARRPPAAARFPAATD